MATTTITPLFLLLLFLLPQAHPLPPPRRPATSSTATASEFLSAHNAVRARHRVPPLRWSATLARYARWYANKRRNDCALVHSSGDFYGENIFWGKVGKRWGPRDAVAAWGSQEKYYDYVDNTCKPRQDCWHYTQVVWRQTKEVGCANVECRSGDSFVVCEYFPPGNVIGQRPY